MKLTIARFTLSCVLMLMIGSFSYYIWTTNNATPTVANLAVETTKQKTTYKLGSSKKDITYCSGQLMDIYHPRVAKYDESPTVLYLHGGGWVLNDKISEPDQLAMIDGLRDDGYTVASINYRKLPTGFYPEAVQDSLCAVRYLRAQASVYGLDPEKIAIYGFSAGGYLAAMVGALPDDSMFETSEHASFSSRVGAVITLAGIFDFDGGLNQGNRERIANFLNGADPVVAEATAYITPDDPSFMLLHGANDQYVSVEQDNIMVRLLQENNISYEQIYITQADHGLNPTGGMPEPDRETVRKRMAEFLEGQLFTK